MGMPHKSAKEEILKRINEREGNAVHVGNPPRGGSALGSSHSPTIVIGDEEFKPPRNGEMIFIFQDGKLVQMDTLEKKRFR